MCVRRHQSVLLIQSLSRVNHWTSTTNSPLQIDWELVFETAWVLTTLDGYCRVWRRVKHSVLVCMVGRGVCIGGCSYRMASIYVAWSKMWSCDPAHLLLLWLTKPVSHHHLYRLTWHPRHLFAFATTRCARCFRYFAACCSYFLVKSAVCDMCAVAPFVSFYLFVNCILLARFASFVSWLCAVCELYTTSLRVKIKDVCYSKWGEKNINVS